MRHTLLLHRVGDNVYNVTLVERAKVAAHLHLSVPAELLGKHVPGARPVTITVRHVDEYWCKVKRSGTFEPSLGDSVELYFNHVIFGFSAGDVSGAEEGLAARESYLLSPQRLRHSMPTATHHCKGAPRNHSKVYKVPRRPFGSSRLDAELKVAGMYGLKNKREIWRIALTLSKIRRAARELLKLDEKDPRRLFEGNAIIRRLMRIGVLDESRMKLDYVLALQIEDFLERRLQTQVYKSGLARSIHHARVLIAQRHIRYVDIKPAFH